MATALAAAGVAVEAVRVKGADHEKDFWSPAVYQTVADFLARQIKLEPTAK